MWRNFAQIRTACSFPRESHRPSVAIRRNLSSACSLRLVTTGSAMTPSVRAQPSPSVREVARPGFSMAALSQTRAGPTSSPASISFATWPPLSMMRSCSSGLSGFRSSVRASASQRGDFASGVYWPSTALESPTLPTWISCLPGSSITTTPVVPLNSTSAPMAEKMSLSVLRNPFCSAFLGWVRGSSCVEAMWEGSRSAAILEAL
mmetsp:Transcript_11079/g.24340  ORF Transcript_11079/g.24340 Transcript_11079/m.24340 type:complete len:205 (+) Transcript_11079:254-868(+)